MVGNWRGGGRGDGGDALRSGDRRGVEVVEVEKDEEEI